MSVMSPPARPIQVEGRVAPAMLLQMVRMGCIIGGSMIAGHLAHEHPSLQTAAIDPRIFGAAGVAALNAAWSMLARYQLCTKLKQLAGYVGDDIAVIKR